MEKTKTKQYKLKKKLLLVISSEKDNLSASPIVALIRYLLIHIYATSRVPKQRLWRQRKWAGPVGGVCAQGHLAYFVTECDHDNGK